MVYDPARRLAHSLNRTALAVWKNCDGHNSVIDLRQMVGAELGLQVEEGAVWLALRQLASAHLLVEPIGDADAPSRRELLRKAGRIGVAAIATPVIASTMVPIAAAAASPPGLPLCAEGGSQKRSDGERGCSSLNESCVCSVTTLGAPLCINPSTALKKTTCKRDSDCHTGYLCIRRGKAPPRCIAPCAVPTCVC